MSYENGLQIVLSLRSLLIQMKIIVDVKRTSAIVKHVETLYGSSSVYRKVLGLNWDTGADDFVFDFENICRKVEKLDVTKRNILRVAVIFFDPVGLISPITLQPKLIF